MADLVMDAMGHDECGPCMLPRNTFSHAARRSGQLKQSCCVLLDKRFSNTLFTRLESSIPIAPPGGLKVPSRAAKSCEGGRWEHVMAEWIVACSSDVHGMAVAQRFPFGG